jgi:uncharacterized membrane protein
MAERVAAAPVRTISIVRHPIYSMLLPVAVVCFAGTILTDLAYLGSGGNLVWLDFSNWLLLAGLLFGVIAALVLAIDFIRSAALRTNIGWGHVLIFYAALLVELFNAFVHDRDGWTAVAGTGILLTVLGALLILVAGWLHRPAVVEAVR